MAQDVITGTFHIKDNVITFQSAKYIEDGWYVEVGDQIVLWEIPCGGGEPMKIGVFTDIISAVKTGIELT